MNHDLYLYVLYNFHCKLFKVFDNVINKIKTTPNECQIFYDKPILVKVSYDKIIGISGITTFKNFNVLNISIDAVAEKLT